MVALARKPGPKHAWPHSTSISRRTGPLTITACAAPANVAVVECAFAFGCRNARTVATTVGKYSGRHPAMTALIAVFSAVTSTLRVGTSPSSRSGAKPPSIAATRSGVGGMTGSPSVKPRSKKSSIAAASSS